MSEHTEQADLFTWIERNLARLPALEMVYAHPNGGKREPQTGAYLKAEGVRAGVLDIHCPVACKGYHGLWIEMKLPGEGPSPEQRWWLVKLEAYGHMAVVCHGWQEAARVLETYLA